MIPLRDANPTRRMPVVTLGLISLCLVMFGYELGLLVSGFEALEAFLTAWGVVPAELTAAWASGAFLSQETLTLISSQFLHADWLHVLGNLLFLWIFGNNIEDRLGRLRFLSFYLGGGVAAALVHLAIDPGSEIPVIGASGSIAATLGAYVVLFPGARITSLVFLGFFYQLIDVPAVVVLVFWFVLQVIDGIASLGVTDAPTGVAFFAHIGGFVAGVLVALAIRAWSTRPGRHGEVREEPAPPAAVG